MCGAQGKTRARKACWRAGVSVPTEAECNEYLRMVEEEEERRFHEAGRKLREEQKKKAEEKAERLKAAAARKLAAILKVKDDRSKEAARRAREQQGKDAQLRMAKRQIKEQQEKYLQQIEERGDELVDGEQVTDIGWTKKKGVAKCLFVKKTSSTTPSDAPTVVQ